MRIAGVEAARARGSNPYPHKFHVDMSTHAFHAKYGHLTNDQIIDTEEVAIAGRVMHKREASNKLHFYDLKQNGCKLQLMANARLVHSRYNIYIDQNSNSSDIIRMTPNRVHCTLCTWRRGEVISLAAVSYYRRIYPFMCDA